MEEIIVLPILKLNGQTMKIDHIQPRIHTQHVNHVQHRIHLFCQELIGIIQVMVDGWQVLERVI